MLMDEMSSPVFWGKSEKYVFSLLNLPIACRVLRLMDTPEKILQREKLFLRGNSLPSNQKWGYS